MPRDSAATTRRPVPWRPRWRPPWRPRPPALRRSRQPLRVGATVAVALALALIGSVVAFVFADGQHLPPVPPGVNAPQFDFDAEIKTDVADILDWDQGAPGTGPGVIAATRDNATGVCTQTNGPATAGGPGIVGAGLLVCDPAQNVGPADTGYTQGSKNEGTKWVIEGASQPKKADLAELMLYAKFGDSTFDTDSDPDDVFLFAGATRLDTNGDTHIDIELNRNNPLVGNGCTTTGPNSFNCPNGPNRSVGDVVIAIDLAQGGATPTERIFVVMAAPLPAGKTCANAPQVSPPCLVEVTVQPGSASGQVNAVEIPAAVWRAVGCDPTSGDGSSGCKLRDQIPARGFMEAFIDLSAFGIEAGCPGFSNALFKTRSSDAINSSLQDFSQGQINITRCGAIAWEKRDGSTAKPPDHALQGGATFTVGGATGPFACLGTTTNPVTVVDNGTNDSDQNAGQLLLQNVCPGTYTVTETAAPSGYAKDSTTTRSVTVISNQTVSIGTKGTDDEGATGDFHNRLGALVIHKNDDLGNPLGGATFSISPNAAACYGGTLTSVTDDADGTTGPNDVDRNPAPGVIQLNRVCLGSYTITETAAPPGFALANPASQGPTPLTEDTPNLTISFTFQNRLGTLEWEKRDDANALQGGVTFSISPNAAACYGGTLTSVTDNGPGDADPDAGQLKLERVCLGTYTITETAAPTGFAKDTDDTRAQTVSEANLNAVVGTQGTNDPGTTDESDFHNRLGSITINKTDKLTNAPVTVGGATFTVGGATGPFACRGDSTNPVTVVDDADGTTGPNDVDQNPAPGVIQLNRVCLSATGYTVTETVPPSGYSLPSPNFQGPTPLTDAVTITFTFTDLPLLKLRVQVLRMSDDSVVSGVGLDLNSLAASCTFAGADPQTQPTGAGAGGTGEWTNLNLNCLVTQPGYEVKITTPDP